MPENPQSPRIKLDASNDAAHIKSSLQDTVLFPFWLTNDAAPGVEPQLIGRASTDLLIVGAGFTGLWAAIQSKEENPDRDVILIEANRVAYGASGRPGGIVSTSIMHGLSNALRIFPNDLEILEQIGHDNMRGFRDSLERYRIDCNAEWNGELTVAIGQERVSDLDPEFELHSAHGHDVEMLDEDQIRAQIDSPLYSGGVWSKGNSGTVHPAKLAWGLKRAALSLGVRLHELTPMTTIEERPGGLTVKTRDGEVRTPKVLLATNAFASGHRHIRRRVTAIRDRIITTEPLSDEQLSRIGWSNRQGVYDTRTQLNYTRLTNDNRIVFGGRLGYFFNDNTDPHQDRHSSVYEPLAKAFFSTFPQLEDVRFSHAWSGPIGLTTRMAVHFQRYFDDKLVYAGGYSGFGISSSRFGARVALGILHGEDAPESKLDLVNTLPNRIPGEPFRWLGALITMYALDTADEKGGWRIPWLKLVTKLGFPIA